ncbi:MAG: glycosyltransferase family 2 protein [Alphaproteobacteria bacterium]|nr:glycosyltransferase family 2 protein [Alphaproteobacteria bacterium]
MVEPVKFKHPCIEAMVSVIIPVRADVEGLAITLQSLVKTAPHTQRYEIIVANDGADEDITTYCEKYPQVIEKSLIPNQGPGGARNYAMEFAQGEFVAFLDADVVVREGWWQAMRNALSTHDYAAGRVDIDPSLITSFFHKYDQINAFNVKEYMRNHHGATANVSVRRSLLKEIGGFDARFRSGEDTEFGIRAHEQGQRMVYADDMRIFHPPRSFQEQRKKIYRVVVGHAQLREAYPTRFDKYKVTPRMVVSFVVPPRRLGKDPKMLESLSPSTRAGLYLTCYAARLYQISCYVWTSLLSAKRMKHDLS